MDGCQIGGGAIVVRCHGNSNTIVFCCWISRQMPDMHVEKGGASPYDPRMEARVARLEEDMREVKGILARLEPMIIRIDAVVSATLPTLATKGDLADLRSELRGELAEKPSKTYMWGLLGVLIAAYAAGLAAMAVIR